MTTGEKIRRKIRPEEACRVMTNGDHEGCIFLSHPHRKNGFFFLLTTKYLILYWKKHVKDFQ